MILTLCGLIGLYCLYSAYEQANALKVKRENKAIENTYSALQDRKAFALEAQAEDAETYKLAVKIAKR